MAKKKIIKREILPDLEYQSTSVTKFIHQVMKKGKKSLAQKIVYKCFNIIEEKEKKPAIEIFNQAIENTSPKVEVRAKRIGGATYQVPFPVNADRATTLAMRWIISAARKQKGKTMKEKLADQILDSFKDTGIAIKRKENTHRMAQANRAFAHFARSR